MLTLRQRLFSTCNLEKLIHSKNWEEVKSFTDQNSEELHKFLQGSVFHSERQNISYLRFTQQYEDEGFKVLSSVLSQHEPMAKALKVTENQVYKNICKNMFVQSKYSDLSLIAKHKDEVVAASVTLDWHNQSRRAPKTPEENEFWEKVQPLVNFLHKSNLIEANEEGKVAHEINTAVKPEWWNHGIASASIAIRLACYRLLGYKYFIVECGFGSSYANRVYSKYLQFGTEMLYEDYVYQGNKPFESLEGGYLFLYQDLQS